nr:unnamed protein product [Callosobruchus analis]
MKLNIMRTKVISTCCCTTTQKINGLQCINLIRPVNRKNRYLVESKTKSSI